ncbi:MAG TPA: glycine cleavage system protein GcvH [Ignavibacteriales bacterium]|nr:glycine cleavage system protein GcvH [Ignavibacteriales bacterium]HEX3074068.1 glycine cleavage system protein GcvH [Ignavibacteriales bacterium]
MNVPSNLKYTKEHEWVKTEGKIAVIGITDYAQGELGDVVFVDVDPNIKEVKAGQTFGAVEAVKTVSDLYAPCSGKVVELNKKLANDPQLVNSDPYGEGWMIKVEMTNEAELSSLLDAAKYKELVGA